MSDSLGPHGLQPTRLLCPWDFSGKSTGVGCHFLLQDAFKWKVFLVHWGKAKVYECSQMTNFYPTELNTWSATDLPAPQLLTDSMRSQRQDELIIPFPRFLQRSHSKLPIKLMSIAWGNKIRWLCLNEEEFKRKGKMEIKNLLRAVGFQWEQSYWI